MGWLVVEGTSDAKGPRARIPDSGSLVAGRSRHADFVLEGGTISRRHAVFFHRDGTDWIKDAGSKNGCTLNGESVHDPEQLADGDTVTLGSLALRYFEAEPPTLLPKRKEPTLAPAEPGVTPLGDTGRWRGVALVGRGGMGEVYSAYDHDLGDTVAIKRLRRGRNRDLRLLRRLHAREAAIGRTIRHPNVVRVLEDGLYRGDPYMLLEWVEGESLDRLLPMIDTPIADKVEILRQVALGLVAAHSAGVVHADLKPANVMLLPARSPTASDAQNLAILEEPGKAPIPVVSDETIDEQLGMEIARRVGLQGETDFDHLPLVGRDGELALLDQESAVAVDSGEMRWILIYGDKGVGKRRLVREFLELRKKPDAPQLDVHVLDDMSAPPADGTGLWISLLPPSLPEDPGIRRAYERGKVLGVVCELYLKPFLRGQAIRLVEQVVKHPPSAREFVDTVEQECQGRPRQIIDALRRSFDADAWSTSGGGYRFHRERFRPDELAVGRTLLERSKGEEKGLRDLLAWVSPIGDCLDFEIAKTATHLDGGQLFYLIDYATKQSYLEAGEGNSCRFTNEPFRRALEKSLEEGERRGLVQRALPAIEARLDGNQECGRMFIRAASLQREYGRLDTAFGWYLRGALEARSRYDRDAFLECIDAARECYRSEPDSTKKFGEQLERLFGSAGKGLSGIDRLRQLPSRVCVKIADFGISRRLGSDGHDDHGETWGTPRYMSPEQVRRDPLTPASDIFSLGILARELLDGRHPVGDLKGKAALSAILQGSIGAPTEGRAGIPYELSHLLMRMLDLDPEVRPSAAAVAMELQALQLRLFLAESRS